jgi:hypothetical protein
MFLKSHRPLLLAAVLILAAPATFATAQAAPQQRYDNPAPQRHDNQRHAETLRHRQQAAACGHIHSARSRHSCEARVSHQWQQNRHR